MEYNVVPFFLWMMAHFNLHRNVWFCELLN